MPGNTDEQLRRWNPYRQQAWWDKYWRRMPNWRLATFDNLERSFAGSIVDVAVHGERRAYTLESAATADIIADCLRCVGATVEQPQPRVVVCQ